MPTVSGPRVRAAGDNCPGQLNQPVRVRQMSPEPAPLPGQVQNPGRKLEPTQKDMT